MEVLGTLYSKKTSGKPSAMLLEGPDSSLVEEKTTFPHHGFECLARSGRAESYELSVPFPAASGLQCTGLGVVQQHKAKEMPSTLRYQCFPGRQRR